MSGEMSLPAVTPAPIQPLLKVRGLCKHYPVYSKGLWRRQIGTIKACHEIDFDLFAGETLGLVGESGCGKTTTGRAILRAIDPTRGSVVFQSPSRGAVDLARLSAAELKPLRTELQMVFQDPFSSLNPRMTVADIVAEPLVIHRMGDRAEREARVVAMLRRVGLRPEHRTRYPHAFSGGQRQRIGIARALIMNPRLVVCDESVSALDVSVQAQVINLLRELQAEYKLTYLFIAHDLSVVRHLCDRVAVMYAGRIVELATGEALFAAPQHPYTRALLAAVPNPDPDVPMALAMAGEPANLAKPPGGCAFHPRCVSCMAHCRSEEPRLAPRGGRLMACHLQAEDGTGVGASAAFTASASDDGPA